MKHMLGRRVAVIKAIIPSPLPCKHLFQITELGWYLSVENMCLGRREASEDSEAGRGRACVGELTGAADTDAVGCACSAGRGPAPTGGTLTSS